jgi:hypothetical protein
MPHYAMIPMSEYEEYMKWKKSIKNPTPKPTYKNINDSFDIPF